MIDDFGVLLFTSVQEKVSLHIRYALLLVEHESLPVKKYMVDGFTLKISIFVLTMGSILVLECWSNGVVE